MWFLMNKQISIKCLLSTAPGFQLRNSCVYIRTNNSADKDFSFHSLSKDKKLIKVRNIATFN